MRRLLVALVGILALTCQPASADVYEPATPLPTPAGYTGPAIYGLWPTTGTPTVIPVYARTDRRWGVLRVVRQWNAASNVQLVVTSTPCAGCITIRQTRDRAAFAMYNTATYEGADVVGGFADYQATDGVMQQCDVVLNRGLFDHMQAVERRMVAAHEIGHCLGLGHSDVRGTIMGQPKRNTDGGPSELDALWLGQLYGPAA